MCGLVGVAGDLSGKEDRVFKELLFISSLRGMDSTGAGFIPKNEKAEPTVSKGLGGPWNLVSHKNFKKGIALNNVAIIGHNRYATIGKVNRLNAHPFENDSVIGVHNGTLTNRRLLPDHEIFTVDSENIFHSFDVKGEKETIKNLEGAFALVWWDKKERKLKFIRNDKRPLYYAYNVQRTIIFWSSEREMLEFTLERCRVNYKQIFHCNVKSLYSFEFPDKHPKKIVTMQEEVEFYKPPIQVYTENAWGHVGDWMPGRHREHRHNKRNTQSGPAYSSSTPAKIGKVTMKGERDPRGEYSLNKKMRKAIAKGKLPHTVKGPKDQMFNKEKFEAYIAIAGACCWCSATPIYGDDIRYLSYPDFLCSTCKDDPAIMQYAN